MSKLDETPIESRAIALRAFVTKTNAKAPQQRPSINKQRRAAKASRWTLVFDTETTTDETQNLRFGTFQVRQHKSLDRQGIFYNDDALTDGEIGLLREYTKTHNLELLNVTDFIEGVFFKYGYDYRGTVVGFNLPFDISRLAIGHTSARSNVYNKIMAGGFSFKLTENHYRPRIQIKHISSRNAFIQFTKPGTQPLARSERKKQRPQPTRRGFFTDCKTLAAALTSQSHSLDSLAKTLGVSSLKQETEEHGKSLTVNYINYAMRDTQTTWECYTALLDIYHEHGLSQTEPHTIHSEASLGKAYFKQMGINPWQSLQPEFPDEMLGIIMSTYFGGRSEVHIRKQPTQVIYTDFLSMYPTVCTLMGLWQFMIAEGVDYEDSTQVTRDFLTNVTNDDFQSQETWKKLTTLVQVLPNKDIFPVRAKYGDRQYTIGQNYLMSEKPLWFTLADCIASKLLKGKAPTIVKAITFSPKRIQDSLKSVCIAGNNNYEVDPKVGDFFKRVIDLRRQIKDDMKAANDDEKAILQRQQLAIKILANATSYGVFVELNVEGEKTKQDLALFGYDGKAHTIKKEKFETTGKYFHPLLASLITGAARLMLAITEHLAIKRGLDWCFCDTDSMALAKPQSMRTTDFVENAQNIVDWFVPLNPYEAKGSLLKMEDYNFALPDLNRLEPLYCLAISSKRYALFNLQKEKPILRKVSAHGLGHLIAPYKDSKKHTLEGAWPWQQDLWLEIISAALENRQPDYANLKGMNKSAVSRYAATSPHLLNWCKRYNKNKPYIEQIKPFNFLLALQGNLYHGNIKPIAPFNKDIQQAFEHCVDRETGERIYPDELKSFIECIAQYHLHPEDKFLNGDFEDEGITKRRHIEVTSIQHIGKEANKWEEQFYLGVDADAQIEYGVSEDSSKEFLERLKHAVEIHGAKLVAEKLGYSKRYINYILCGKRKIAKSKLLT